MWKGLFFLLHKVSLKVLVFIVALDLHLKGKLNYNEIIHAKSKRDKVYNRRDDIGHFDYSDRKCPRPHYPIVQHMTEEHNNSLDTAH